MVYCSHCGTQNRDGSKFCNNCGARLMPESGLRCPMCSTPNPVESVFCVNCGARLVPLTAASIPETKPAAPPIKGLSLPAKPDIPIQPAESSESTEEPAQPTAPEAAVPLAANELPDWIARLRTSGTTGDEKPESEEPSANETPAQDDAGVPDWLTRLRSTPAAENAPPADADSDLQSQFPSWITEPTSAARPAAESADVSSEEDMPDWLKQSQGELSPTPKPAEQTPELAEPTPEPPAADARPAAESAAVPAEKTDMPDWLKQSQGELPPTPEPAAQTPELAEPTPEPPATDARPVTASETVPAEKGQVPDWLKQSQGESQPTPEPPPSDAKQTEEPDWLKQSETSVPSAAEKSELPEWLKSPALQTGPSEEKAEEPAPPVELEQPAEESKSEEPLIESLEEAELAEFVEREPFVLPQTAPSEEDELPDWLRTAKSPEAPLLPVPAIEQPSPGDVPSWVAELKPAELTPTPAAVGLATNEIELTGPLEGLRGVLPLAVAIAEPHSLGEAPKSISQTEGGQIFESILAAPVSPPVSAPKAARFVLTMRPFIYLLLLLAVLVPFLLPYDITQSSFSIAGTPAAEFYDAIQVPANSTILLSFDYDPSVSGEMDLQARAIVGDLIKRRVKIIAVSTIETGPQIAQRILNEAAAAANNYVYGSSYIIVYLPGHEAGLAQLASAGFATATDYVNKQSVAAFLAAAKIKNVGDFPLVIEFAGSEEPLKTWVEQVQPRTGVRIAAAVSASVEPKARAYRNANQLTAMLSGLLGAAQYEALSSHPGLAVISVNAQSAAQLVLVFVIVLGNVAFWISRARGGAK